MILTTSTRRRSPLTLACSLALASASGLAQADQAADMQSKLDALQKQIAEMQSQINPAAPSGVRSKPGDGATLQIGDNSEVTLYGHVDLSLDYQTTGLASAAGAKGNNGWLADVSSNSSMFGLRGFRRLNDDLKAVFQFETEVFYSATPGTADTAADTTAQKTGLGSRNSYLGLQSATLGALKLGKTDTPYKTSTGRLDPFSNSVADYNSIMGNSGGDTRAEFDLRLPHSIWYESPKWSGLSLGVLFSPGQNRSTDGLQYPQGEPDCSGGNTGGCNDGAFKNAYSLALAYDIGPLYATAAYEMHGSVNRGGDDLAPGSVGIANESALKVGVQYAFPEGTTVNAIFERIKRSAITDLLDERSRNGMWLAVTQKLSDSDDVYVGWAHAGKTPGNPNGAPANMNGVDGSGQAVSNAANQYSVGYKHRFEDRKVSAYAAATDLRNGEYAHYALGVSGHGITARNKDGDGTAFSGNELKAITVGMTYDF